MTALLELSGITKRFGDLTANQDVDLTVEPGQVVGMLGENGAGKSTLMKIVYGLLAADEGRIAVDGREVQIGSPRDAMAAGIGMVTQEFSLVETMTVTENVALSSLGVGRVRLDRARDRVLAAMDEIGVHIDPDRRVSSLSIGERQRVEIVKALFHDCRILILDEPTAVLTPQDVEALFATVDRLKEHGLGVLLVSHKLKEVARACDRVVVLRRGTVVGERETVEVTPTELAALMMGVTASEVDGGEQAAAAAVGMRVQQSGGEGSTVAEQTPVLAVRDLVVHDRERAVVDGLTLDVLPGEILGVAGISGNGQTELVEALCGTRPTTSGSVHVDGRDLGGLDVPARLEAGLGRLTEDRRGSVVPHLSVEQNLVLEQLDDFTRRGFVDRRAVRRHAEAMIEQYEIKATPSTPVGQLSGGNIQKVLLARTLHRRPRILVAAQPTRGLDIGAYRYVHDQLNRLREEGAGVLLVAEDLDELRGLSDRIVVLLRGALVGELPVAEADPERLGLLMAGEGAA